MNDKKVKNNSLMKKIAIGFLSIFGLGVALVSIFVMVILFNTPHINPKNMVFAENSIIYDSKNKANIRQIHTKYVVFV